MSEAATQTVHGGVEVGELTEAHVEDAATLWHRVGLTRPWNDAQADCRRALASRESTVLGLWEPSSGAAGIIGTVMVGHDGHRGWVYYLAVEPSQQGRGHGARLVSAAEDWLRNRDVPKLMLMVRTENPAVRSFYERLGYTQQEVITLGRFLTTSPHP